MPRLARIETPSVLHHIIIRGIERRPIFKDNQDRESFLERLCILLPETETICYAWALMSDHAHFLLRSGPKGISHLMRRLLTGHAVSFNRRHRRHGQLFQNRYKSIICQEDLYFKELVRYIHLNPVRAKIIKDLRGLHRYPYCGHSAIMGKTKRAWQQTEYVLSYFGQTRASARRKYAAYMKAGWSQGRLPELIGGGFIRSLGGWTEVKKRGLKGQGRIKSDERILGESDFVAEVLSQANERFDRKYELKRLGYDLDRVAARVAEIYKIEVDEIFIKGKQQKRVKARSLFCFWAARELGISHTELARRLGLSVPGVGYSVERGEIIARDNDYQLIE